MSNKEIMILIAEFFTFILIVACTIVAYIFLA